MEGTMRMLKRAVLLTLVLVALPMLAQAQAPYPPSTWHPYRGGVNCVQVSDANGNFNCSALVTIDPVTGAFNSVLGGPVSRAITLVIGPSGNTLQALSNDLVIATSSNTVAPAGPGVGGATLRLRPSPVIPGMCRLTIAVGNSFGNEYVIGMVDPAPYAYGALGTNPTLGVMVDNVLLDIPGPC